MTPRIVATGAGTASPVGAGIEAFGKALWSGASGIRSSPRFPGSFTSECIAFDAGAWLGKGVRTLDRGTRLLCVAAQLTLAATGLSKAAADRGDAELGLICGTMFGGVHSIATFDCSGLTEGPAYVSPLEFPNTVINAPAGQVAIKYGLRGVNSTISSGLASGLCAIQYAAEFLRVGRARYLMAGGMEEVCDEAALGFRKLGLASPSGVVRPFGTERDGTAAGEGAALWMLETEGSALGRGLTPWFEIAGGGAAHDAWGASESSGRRLRIEAAIDAVKQALEEAGIGPNDIGCVIASANGDRMGDEIEAHALAHVFGSRLGEIPVSAPKATFGEAMGASGAFCAIAGGLALQRQEAPPTAGFSDTDSGLRLSSEAQPFISEYALINAFGCGGNNAAMVIRQWKK